MNILFLSTWFPYPPDNGSKIRVYHLLRALAQRHDVTLLSFAFGTARPQEATTLRNWCARVEAVECDPFARHHVPALARFLSPRPVVTAPLPEMAAAVDRVAAETTFDAVIASTEVMATYAAHLDGTPLILEEHNSFSRMMQDRYDAQQTPLQRLRCWASWQKTRYYEAALFRRCDLCVMVSEQDRQATLALPRYRGRVVVIPNGVDCEHHRPGLTAPVPDTLIYNGALTYSANYDAMRYYLTEIHPLIRRENPHATLTITGATAGVDLSGLPLDDGVHLSGYVDDIRPLVAGASVCIAPLRQGGGTRLKILEAMALGTPVVATRKGAEGLDVSDGVDIVLADQPAAFAAAVLQLLRDPAERARLAANARRLVESRYDWAQIGQCFVELVEDVVAQRRQERAA